MITWDVLIASIPHRHEKLLRLLDELDRQIWLMMPEWSGEALPVGALLYRDDLELPYGDKTQALVEASTADYVSCIDDDDLPAPGMLAKVMTALEVRPDYVGFKVRWTRDGMPQRPVTHSLACGGWHDNADWLERDITQFNPIRRDLALLGKWEGGWEAERRWGNAVRDTGRVKHEEFIDEEMYYYQESATDTFQTGRKPLGRMPELPDYPWLKQIGPYA